MTLSEWVTASQIRNFFLNDPILDWLEKYGELKGYKKDEKKIEFDFNQFIQQKGIEFEKRVYQYFNLTPLLPYEKDVIRNLDDLHTWFNHTKTTLKTQPALAQALILDETKKLWGIPDFITTVQWLQKHYAYDLQNTKELTNANPETTYVIGDIKYTTFKPKSLDPIKQKTELHSWIRTHKYYIGQLWFYHQILQSFLSTAPFAFLMLRDPSPIPYNENPGRIIIIDFNNEKLSSYLHQTRQAIHWIQTLESEGQSYDIGAHPYLYPNMSNKDDYPWHDTKKTIALELDELTQLWYINPAKRVLLHENGIKTCSDLGEKYLKDPSVLSIVFKTKGTIYKAFEAILKANYGTHEIYMGKNPTIEQLWFHENQHVKEFYVDYETFSGINDTFQSFPEPSYSNLIFMIGVGIELNGTWHFKCFIAENNTPEAEKQIIQEFYSYLWSQTKSHGKTEFRVYHWAPHEKTELKKAAERHGLPYDYYIKRFIDLEKIFEKQPIGVKGAYSYSIKAIAPALKNLGFTKTAWPKGGLADGLSAMVGAWHAYEQAQNTKTSIHENPIMQEIKDYNEVDCKVMYEIHKWMRSHRKTL